MNKNMDWKKQMENAEVSKRDRKEYLRKRKRELNSRINKTRKLVYHSNRDEKLIKKWREELEKVEIEMDTI